MQGVRRAILSHGNVLKNAVVSHVRVTPPAMRSLMFARNESTASAARMEEHGFESTKISDILAGKGKTADGSWLWCTTEDTVYDAVKSMTQHNVGALVVVKPGEQKAIAGIVRERGRFYAFEKAHRLDLNSNGRGVRHFKTNLRSVKIWMKSFVPLS